MVWVERNNYNSNTDIKVFYSLKVKMYLVPSFIHVGDEVPYENGRIWEGAKPPYNWKNCDKYLFAQILVKISVVLFMIPNIIYSFSTYWKKNRNCIFFLDYKHLMSYVSIFKKKKKFVQNFPKKNLPFKAPNFFGKV